VQSWSSRVWVLSSFSLPPSAPNSSSLPPSPLMAVCPVLRAFAHSLAVGALTPARSPPAPHDLRTPSDLVYLRALLQHGDGEEKMYQWHGTGNPTNLPAAAGSTSSLESRNRGEKCQKCSGARQERAAEVRASSDSSMVCSCVCMGTGNAVVLSACPLAAGHGSVQLSHGWGQGLHCCGKKGT